MATPVGALSIDLSLKIRKAMEETQVATVAKVRDLVERGGRFSAAFGV